MPRARRTVGTSAVTGEPLLHALNCNFGESVFVQPSRKPVFRHRPLPRETAIQYRMSKTSPDCRLSFCNRTPETTARAERLHDDYLELGHTRPAIHRRQFDFVKSQKSNQPYLSYQLNSNSESGNPMRRAVDHGQVQTRSQTQALIQLHWS
jgi:hypothetical protein